MSPTRRRPWWALVAFLGVVCWWPTAGLPWSHADSYNHYRIMEALDQASLWECISIAMDPRRHIDAAFAGEFHPGLWVIYFGIYKAIGAKVLAHRVVRLITLCVIGLWVQAFARRATGSDRFGLAAACGFLLFPAQVECASHLPMAEPCQAVALCLFHECLWRWLEPGGRRGWLAGAWGALVFAVSVKETSWCVVASVAVIHLMIFHRGFDHAERPRLSTGLWQTWLVVALFLAAFVGLGAGQPLEGTWASAYDPSPATMLASASYYVRRLWSVATLLVPMGGLGLCLALAASGLTRENRAALIALTWGLAGVAIFLPWPYRQSRYFLLASPGLCIAVTAGLHRLAKAWPLGGIRGGDTPLVCGLGLVWLAWDGCLRGQWSPWWLFLVAGALPAAWGLSRAYRDQVAGGSTAHLVGLARVAATGCSAVWMALSFFVAIHDQVRLSGATDATMYAVVDALARRAGPSERILHVIPAGEPRNRWPRFLESHLQTMGGRKDLRVRTAIPGQPPAGGVPDWVVVAPMRGRISVSEVAAWLGASLEPVVDARGTAVHRDMPDLRWGLKWLATRVTAAGGVCQGDLPLLPGGWTQAWHWQLLRVAGDSK